MTNNTSMGLMIPDPPAPPVPGRKVLGWLLVCFAVAPLAMAARGDGIGYFWAGAAMLTVGGALALIPGRDRKAT